MPNMCWQFGQNNCCHWLWKVAQSVINRPIWSHWMQAKQSKGGAGAGCIAMNHFKHILWEMNFGVEKVWTAEEEDDYYHDDEEEEEDIRTSRRLRLFPQNKRNIKEKILWRENFPKLTELILVVLNFVKIWFSYQLSRLRNMPSKVLKDQKSF